MLGCFTISIYFSKFSIWQVFQLDKFEIWSDFSRSALYCGQNSIFRDKRSRWARHLMSTDSELLYYIYYDNFPGKVIPDSVGKSVPAPLMYSSCLLRLPWLLIFLPLLLMQFLLKFYRVTEKPTLEAYGKVIARTDGLVQVIFLYKFTPLWLLTRKMWMLVVCSKTLR